MEVRLRFSLLKVEQTDPIKASVDLLYSPPVLRGLNVCWTALTGWNKTKLHLRKYKYYSQSCLQVEGEGEGNNPLRWRRVYLTQYLFTKSVPHMTPTLLFYSNFGSKLPSKLFP